MKSKKKGIIILLFMGIIISLILVEVIIRIHYFGILSLNPIFGKSISYLDYNQIYILSPNYIDILSNNQLCNTPYELKPNQNIIHQLVYFSTNNQGFVGKNYSKIKNPNTKRIIIIGSSFSLPLGINYEESYPRLLEKELNKRGNYEVINMAVLGNNLENSLTLLKNCGFEYEPDMILFDINYLEYTLPKKENNITRISVNKKNPYLKYWTSFFLYGKINDVNKNRNKIPYDKEKLDEILNEIKKIDNEFNLTLLVLRRYESEAFYEYNLLKEKNKDYNFTIIDTASEFGNKSYVLNKLDFHPNAEAHKLFAQKINKELKNI
ncbi:MAG: hypothetical protein QW727_01195 [Candidatus Pacearchaeota archaeon]